MKKLNFGIILALALVFSLSSCRDLSTNSKVLINEVLMTNESNATDEYGAHSAWIELFVKYYGPIDVAGYIIEAEQGGQLVSYTIPKGDVITKVQPRQYIVFWADGQPNRGTLHTNFTLDANQTTTIRLRNSNKDVIDEVTIPAGTLSTNQAYGRIDPLATERGPENWEVKDSSDGNPDTYVTPKASNRVLDQNIKMENFQEKDKSGIGMALSAMAVVFSCLLLLFIAFRTVSMLAIRMAKKNEMTAKGAEISKEAMKEATKKENHTSGEELAAIAMALHEMQNDVHDIEDMLLTINMAEKRDVSPWSNKSYMMRHQTHPHRK